MSEPWRKKTPAWRKRLKKNWSRPYNPCFLHVSEQADGQDILGVTNQLIPLFLGKENLLTLVIINLAHHSATARRQDYVASQRPIPFNFKIQNKMRILLPYWNKRNSSSNVCALTCFQIFSAGLPKKHRPLDPIKKKLCNISYCILYSAML